MSVEEIETLVVGGGQVGLAMSEHLTCLARCRLSRREYRSARL